MGLVVRVLSGGQSGVDRAALVVARDLGLEHGGWCPPGGWSEDFADLREEFPTLREAGSVEERTRLNVRDADATLVLVRDGVSSPGTQATVAAAVQLQKVHLVADVSDEVTVGAWLAGLGEVSLNVAGPRESEAPGVQAEAELLLRAVLRLGQPRV